MTGLVSGCYLSLSERHTAGRATPLEEQSGQALLRRRGLHDLLQRHPQLQLLPAPHGLSHVQEEVPRGLPGELRVCVCVCVYAACLHPVVCVCVCTDVGSVPRHWSGNETDADVYNDGCSLYARVLLGCVIYVCVCCLVCLSA